MSHDRNHEIATLRNQHVRNQIAKVIVSKLPRKFSSMAVSDVRLILDLESLSKRPEFQTSEFKELYNQWFFAKLKYDEYGFYHSELQEAYEKAEGKLAEYYGSQAIIQEAADIYLKALESANSEDTTSEEKDNKGFSINWWHWLSWSTAKKALMVASVINAPAAAAMMPKSSSASNSSSNELGNATSRAPQSYSIPPSREAEEIAVKVKGEEENKSKKEPKKPEPKNSVSVLSEKMVSALTKFREKLILLHKGSSAGVAKNIIPTVKRSVESPAVKQAAAVIVGEDQKRIQEYERQHPELMKALEKEALEDDWASVLLATVLKFREETLGRSLILFAQAFLQSPDVLLGSESLGAVTRANFLNAMLLHLELFSSRLASEPMLLSEIMLIKDFAVTFRAYIEKMGDIHTQAPLSELFQRADQLFEKTELTKTIHNFRQAFLPFYKGKLPAAITSPEVSPVTFDGLTVMEGATFLESNADNLEEAVRNNPSIGEKLEKVVAQSAGAALQLAVIRFLSGKFADASLLYAYAWEKDSSQFEGAQGISGLNGFLSAELGCIRQLSNTLERVKHDDLLQHSATLEEMSLHNSFAKKLYKAIKNNSPHHLTIQELKLAKETFAGMKTWPTVESLRAEAKAKKETKKPEPKKSENEKIARWKGVDDLEMVYDEDSSSVRLRKTEPEKTPEIIPDKESIDKKALRAYQLSLIQSMYQFTDPFDLDVDSLDPSKVNDSAKKAVEYFYAAQDAYKIGDRKNHAENMEKAIFVGEWVCRTAPENGQHHLNLFFMYWDRAYKDSSLLNKYGTIRLYIHAYQLKKFFTAEELDRKLVTPALRAEFREICDGDHPEKHALFSGGFSPDPKPIKTSDEDIKAIHSAAVEKDFNTLRKYAYQNHAEASDALARLETNHNLKIAYRIQSLQQDPGNVNYLKERASFEKELQGFLDKPHKGSAPVVSNFLHSELTLTRLVHIVKQKILDAKAMTSDWDQFDWTAYYSILEWVDKLRRADVDKQYVSLCNEIMSREALAAMGIQLIPAPATPAVLKMFARTVQNFHNLDPKAKAEFHQTWAAQGIVTSTLGLIDGHREGMGGLEKNEPLAILFAKIGLAQATTKSDKEMITQRLAQLEAPLFERALRSNSLYMSIATWIAKMINKDRDEYFWSIWTGIFIVFAFTMSMLQRLVPPFRMPPVVAPAQPVETAAERARREAEEARVRAEREKQKAEQKQQEEAKAKEQNETKAKEQEKYDGNLAKLAEIKQKLEILEKKKGNVEAEILATWEPLIQECRDIVNQKYPFEKASALEMILPELVENFAALEKIFNYLDLLTSLKVLKAGLEKFDAIPGIMAEKIQSSDAELQTFAEKEAAIKADKTPGWQSRHQKELKKLEKEKAPLAEQKSTWESEREAIIPAHQSFIKACNEVDMDKYKIENMDELEILVTKLKKDRAALQKVLDDNEVTPQVNAEAEEYKKYSEQEKALKSLEKKYIKSAITFIGEAEWNALYLHYPEPTKDEIERLFNFHEGYKKLEAACPKFIIAINRLVGCYKTLSDEEFFKGMDKLSRADQQLMDLQSKLWAQYDALHIKPESPPKVSSVVNNNNNVKPAVEPKKKPKSAALRYAGFFRTVDNRKELQVAAVLDERLPKLLCNGNAGEDWVNDLARHYRFLRLQLFFSEIYKKRYKFNTGKPFSSEGFGHVAQNLCEGLMHNYFKVDREKLLRCVGIYCDSTLVWDTLPDQVKADALYSDLLPSEKVISFPRSVEELMEDFRGKLNDLQRLQQMREQHVSKYAGVKNEILMAACRMTLMIIGEICARLYALCPSAQKQLKGGWMEFLHDCRMDVRKDEKHDAKLHDIADSINVDPEITSPFVILDLVEKGCALLKDEASFGVFVGEVTALDDSHRRAPNAFNY